VGAERNEPRQRARSTSRPGSKEYSVLSQELQSLRSRSLVVFGAVLAVAAVGVSKWVELMHAANAGPAHVLALALAFVVIAAMIITYKLYEKGLRIAAYIEVFHEKQVPGWHSRSRWIRQFVRRRGSVPRRTVANVSEPRIVAWLYLPLVISAALLIFAAPVTQVRTWNVAPAALVLGIGTLLFLELGFFFERRDEYWRWWWAEYRRLEHADSGVAERAAHRTRATPRDPVATLVALLLLEVAILFLIGLALQP
jgi:hypothetical protein